MKNRAASGRASERRGRFAEIAAAWLLRLKGYRIVGRRLRPPRGSGAGEIDLVARRGNLLVFVEIKARPEAGGGLSAIGAAQQARLLRAAEWFIKYQPEYATCDLRFDAVVVSPGRWPVHLADAWRAERF